MPAKTVQRIEMSPIKSHDLVYPCAILLYGDFADTQRWWGDLSEGFNFPHLAFRATPENGLDGYYYLGLLPGYRANNFATNSEYYNVKVIQWGTRFPVMVPMVEFEKFQTNKIDVEAWQNWFALLLPPEVNNGRYNYVLFTEIPELFGENCSNAVYS